MATLIVHWSLYLKIWIQCPEQGGCVVLHSWASQFTLSAFLHPGVQMSTSKLSAQSMGATVSVMNKDPTQGDTAK